MQKVWYSGSKAYWKGFVGEGVSMANKIEQISKEEQKRFEHIVTEICNLYLNGEHIPEMNTLEAAFEEAGFECDFSLLDNDGIDINDISFFYNYGYGPYRANVDLTQGNSAPYTILCWNGSMESLEKFIETHSPVIYRYVRNEQNEPNTVMKCIEKLSDKLNTAPANQIDLNLYRELLKLLNNIEVTYNNSVQSLVNTLDNIKVNGVSCNKCPYYGEENCSYHCDEYALQVAVDLVKDSL